MRLVIILLGDMKQEAIRQLLRWDGREMGSGRTKSVLVFALVHSITMAHLSSSRCSFCGFDIGRKHFCCCLSCMSSIHRTCCGISFPKGGEPSWDEFRSSYRCVKCDAGCSTNAACVNEGVVSDGVGGAAVGDGNVVAGGSRDGDDVEAISARGESRPKRAVKRREILDPSHVSKRRKVHKAPEKPKAPSTCRESSPQYSSTPQTPQRNASPIGLLLVMSSILSLLSPISSSPEIPPVPPPRRKRRALQIQNISVSLEDPPVIGDLSFEAVTPVVAVQIRPYDSDGYRDEAPAEPVESTMEQSSFEEPTKSNFQVHHDGSNKGKATASQRRPKATRHTIGGALHVQLKMIVKPTSDRRSTRVVTSSLTLTRPTLLKFHMTPTPNITLLLTMEIISGYHRSQFLPANPRKNEPFFDVKVDFFPENFHQGPIYARSATDRARHLLFFTPVMKRQLQDCRTWFIDATFNFVNDPIKQEIMPFPRVKRIVTDFERAIFVAVRKHFENCTHFGCNFHWCQAIIKKIRDLKLSAAYNKKGPNPIRNFMFRLLCLAYLPAGKIASVFYSLRAEAPGELAELLDYMDHN
ncbi:hypothetical protein OUZ56_003241 [Daphnia magna]|uniref:PHD-type domain-containing protein n=1 Tax=Daphnia magna TaxID=35525 RepID=A0ABR0A8K1_9CRUS|nr:hypothetical protein OUZ56_003241 [Daphnia magna]